MEKQNGCGYCKWHIQGAHGCFCCNMKIASEKREHSHYTNSYNDDYECNGFGEGNPTWKELEDSGVEFIKIDDHWAGYFKFKSDEMPDSNKYICRVRIKYVND